MQVKYVLGLNRHTCDIMNCIELVQAEQLVRRKYVLTVSWPRCRSHNFPIRCSKLQAKVDATIFLITVIRLHKQALNILFLI